MKLTYETRKPLITAGQGDVSKLTLFATKTSDSTELILISIFVPYLVLGTNPFY